MKKILKITIFLHCSSICATDYNINPADYNLTLIKNFQDIGLDISSYTFKQGVISTEENNGKISVKYEPVNITLILKNWMLAPTEIDIDSLINNGSLQEFTNIQKKVIHGLEKQQMDINIQITDKDILNNALIFFPRNDNCNYHDIANNLAKKLNIKMGEDEILSELKNTVKTIEKCSNKNYNLNISHCKQIVAGFTDSFNRMNNIINNTNEQDQSTNLTIACLLQEISHPKSFREKVLNANCDQQFSSETYYDLSDVTINKDGESYKLVYSKNNQEVSLESLKNTSCKIVEATKTYLSKGCGIQQFSF
ncbi:hypothetical protein A3F66_04670 [candidate division TM6 bacterium RIFCSPHIGHO2_12_FULL_32_22]|nr:MAG: hypothetical protein A3F66_04670 [candidate division TM6 bacterium RIFCSPHIGHO2_12_FULL_32_22]